MMASLETVCTKPRQATSGSQGFPACPLMPEIRELEIVEVRSFRIVPETKSASKLG
jgi:hypothetical protein